MTNKNQIAKDRKRKTENSRPETGELRQKLCNYHNAFIWNSINLDLFAFYNLRFVIYNHLLRSKTKFFVKNLSTLTILIFIIFGCSYSFTGSSVPNHLKTIAIPFCIDRSGSGEPTMADDFTTSLIDQFISDNSLAVTDKSKADALLDCTITSIADAPNIIEGGENVSTRRLTITARVIYKDFVLKKTVFDKKFSNYGDYENSGDIPTKRSEAIQTAIDRITEDILLAVVSDW